MDSPHVDWHCRRCFARLPCFMQISPVLRSELATRIVAVLPISSYPVKRDDSVKRGLKIYLVRMSGDSELDLGGRLLEWWSLGEEGVLQF
ncbi:hypothetical protein BHE74_00051924, partial [Ensete ventricosum]